MQPDMNTTTTTPCAFAPCVHLVGPRGLAPVRSCSRTRPRVAMRAPAPRRPPPLTGHDHITTPGAKSPPPLFPVPLPTAARWDGVRRVVKASAVSLSVLLCAFGGTPPTPASASSGAGSVRVQRESASDVEAAAVTLGAVTVGGLVMRAVLASRHDEEKERAKLAAECARLEQEEILHARRLKHKAMERVEGDDDLPEDDTLQSSLMKRMQDLGDDEAGEKEDKFMRHTPIPDRGTGSMLLDRPDDAAVDEEEKGAGEEEDVSPERLEMLNRMWNLSSPDDDERKS